MNRDASHVLVVSGLPGAGKTTVAQRVQRALSWPLMAKDHFKERLFDVLGSPDPQASKQLSIASYALMFDMTRQLAAHGISVMLEGNFRWPEVGQHFEALSPGVRFIQLWCTAPVEVLISRLQLRAQDKSRHPGHHDDENLAQLVQEVSSQTPTPLPLPGELITVDTSKDTLAAVAKLVTRLIRTR
jgi:predicted kinase